MDEPLGGQIPHHAADHLARCADHLCNILLAELVRDHLAAIDCLRGLKQLAFFNAQPVGAKIISLFNAGEFDVCTLFFAEFKSVISQKPTALQLIPAAVVGGKAPELGGAIYDAEPDEGEILADLLPRNISIQVFRALLENAASEQGARMSAMDSATRNAGDMINKLSIKYNRQRQAQITKELIEIISGAEAL